jgi:GT2 family glycosyltransferase
MPGMISVVVPSRNRRELLCRTLDALSAAIALHRGPVEVIVVDDGSTDGADVVAREHPTVTATIRASGTISAIRNAGAAVAQGDLLQFLDNDVLVRPDHFGVLRALADGSAFSAFGCECNIPADAPWTERVWYQLTVDNGTREVEYLNSGNFAVRAQVFRDLGGFPTDFETGEDTELCRRLRSAGYTILQHHDLDTIHLGNPKTVLGFFQRLVWHGRSVLQGQRITLRHTSTRAALLFSAFLVSAIVMLLLSCWSWALSLAVSQCVPAAIYAYRVFRNRRVVEPVKALLLINLMLLARLAGLAGAVVTVAWSRIRPAFESELASRR